MDFYNSQFSGREVDDAVGKVIDILEGMPVIKLDTSEGNPADLNMLISANRYYAEYYINGVGGADDTRSPIIIDVNINNSKLEQKYYSSNYWNTRIRDDINNVWGEWVVDKSFTDLKEQVHEIDQASVTIKSEISDISESGATIESLQGEIAVLKNRISLLIANEGTAINDQELQDIRLGANGTTYATAGDAVRDQINQQNIFINNLTNSINTLLDQINA